MIKKANGFIYLILILSFIFLSSCSSRDKGVAESSTAETKNTKSSSTEINNIEIIYTIEDAVKEVDPAIIDAAKQAIQNDENNRDGPRHYDKIYIDIFEVKNKANDFWEVRYMVKTKETESFEMDSYAMVTVEKQPSGDFKGYILNPGGYPISNGK